MIGTKNNWESVTHLNTKNFKCGFQDCGREIGSEKGWQHHKDGGPFADALIYICPNCKRPNFFDLTDNTQIPGACLGNNIKHLPKDIEKLWQEILKATAQSAYTCAVLTGRKLLMHISVEQNAAENLSFLEYVNFLVDNHFAPPNSKVWVDKIRTLGNEANHEIKIMSKDEASDIITFLEMLLKFIYEFPGHKQVETK
ncbi:MAG: hypothetical protein COU29_00405 [Candidatus Magasanikbacteria bacterium CG10_big_fil_rev_8_21_14_0_10_36_32]|uniref:DUF4145 domain-containing protein n=1 Tax=Candidatus Magasanikbacteria bacterium CG10_big_fil_rev_8_21_14_0_10_36_32 TaxID=1974646 RepID=A0A2M6W7U0_9BACT|nr:MAG: hypothetical protein COU29_00405 [Candidatus Magasanikbacteria bacterium CG10_big_fil_rev_8_21_14_0_10_36_32]